MKSAIAKLGVRVSGRTGMDGILTPRSNMPATAAALGVFHNWRLRLRFGTAKRKF
jgi:hypothetical protein